MVWALSSGHSLRQLSKETVGWQDKSEEKGVHSFSQSDADEINFFGEKTTVLAEKIFHPATSAWLTVIVPHVCLITKTRVTYNPFVSKSFHRQDANILRYVLKLVWFTKSQFTWHCRKYRRIKLAEFETINPRIYKITVKKSDVPKTQPRLEKFSDRADAERKGDEGEKLLLYRSRVSSLKSAKL